MLKEDPTTGQLVEVTELQTPSTEKIQAFIQSLEDQAKDEDAWGLDKQTQAEAHFAKRNELNEQIKQLKAQYPA